MTKQFQANTIPSLIDTFMHISNVRLLNTAMERSLQFLVKGGKSLDWKSQIKKQWREQRPSLKGKLWEDERVGR